MRCNNCNYQFSESVQKCPSCGSITYLETDTEDYCPECHAKIDINMSKCATCGFNLKKMNFSLNEIPPEKQEKIGKSILKIGILLWLLPLLPFILVVLGIGLTWLIGSKIISVLTVVTIIKYLLILFSIICFIKVLKNISEKNNKKISNIIFGILGILFISPVLYFSFFSKIYIVDAKKDFNINNYSIPTLYRYTGYDNTLINFRLHLSETSDNGQKLEGDCFISLYHEKIPQEKVYAYEQGLSELGYQREFLDDEQTTLIKNNSFDFIIINIEGSAINYCVAKGNFEDYKGEWGK